MADDFGIDDYRADPLRRGVLAHCYRLLGSIHEAERLTDQTITRHYATPDLPDIPYDGRPRIGESALRRLNGEATLACLADAGIRTGRPLPTALADPNDHPEGELAERPEVLWLEPIPDDLVDGSPVGLELVAALQLLPPQARAAMILSDEGWSPEETSELLKADATKLLQEARSQFNPAPPHTGTDRPDLLDSYSFAFETYDVPAIVELFAPDAIWEMPPFTSWFRGAKNIGKLISTHCPAKGPGDQLLVPVWANGQPGFAVYMRDENVHRAFQIQVLTLTAAGIIHAVAFFDPSLFDAFHLPDLFTQLPENAFEHRPRLHVERIRHPHGE